MSMDEKLDKIVDKLGAIDSTLAAQHVTLQEHTRRSTLLEEDMKPIKKHVNMVEGAIKFIGLVGIIATIVEAIHMMFK